MPSALAAILSSHKEHTLSDATNLPRGTIGIHCRVTTAGLLSLATWDGVVVEYPLDTGTHQLPGEYMLARSTDTTAVLSPASTVIALVGHN